MDTPHAHDHTHDHPQIDPAADPAEFWEARYRDRQQWSGRANPVLVDVVTDLEPGTALDLGCGEGGDAIWLAGHGWRVTAVDIARAALTRGAQHAADAGVGDRITWERHDLSRSFPAGTFDLVSAQFLQSPVELDRLTILRLGRDAVALGGRLLVVGHAEPPSWAPPAMRDQAQFLQADEVLADLDLPAGWTVERADQARRDATGPDGQHGSLVDSVVLVRRGG